MLALRMLALLLVLALLMLTVLLVVLMGRRGLGGGRRSKRQRQGGEKIFHHSSPEGRIVRSQSGEGARRRRIELRQDATQCRDRGAIRSAMGGSAMVAMPTAPAGMPAQVIMQSIEP